MAAEHGAFPLIRGRRLRRTAGLRRLVRQTRLHPQQLIYPIFVVPGQDRREAIPSMPGQHRWSVDRLEEAVAPSLAHGVSAFLLFGIPEHKDARGSAAWAAEGTVQRALRRLRERAAAAGESLVLITDVCLCQYTDHGHCGIVRDETVSNDETLPLLARTAVSHAAAGADVVAPSDMMDGRVGAIRQALDEAGHQQVAILSYAVKFASTFYGPFRDAAASAPSFGHRHGYQMDVANAREAGREARLDLAEGADMVMVKPALAFLDIIQQVRQQVDVPVAAYQVSGEYAMIHAAAERGWLDERRAVLETLTAMVRAGADLLITYEAPRVARWLAEESP